ncbi:hypothetical protein [Catellatospora sp. NPDC049133]
MLFHGVFNSALTLGYAVVLGQSLRMLVQYQIWAAPLAATGAAAQHRVFG